jgi:hypothetical protein
MPITFRNARLSYNDDNWSHVLWTYLKQTERKYCVKILYVQMSWKHINNYNKVVKVYRIHFMGPFHRKNANIHALQTTNKKKENVAG